MEQLEARRAEERLKKGSEAPSREANQVKTSEERKISAHLLEQMAEEILERTKQLGLFDEMRMRLLGNLEANKEFQRAKSDFKREVDTFCARVDLSQPRAKLRLQLNQVNLHKSATRLREQVGRVARCERTELRQLYEQQANEFLGNLRRKVVQVAQVSADCNNNRETKIVGEEQRAAACAGQHEVAPPSSCASTASADSGFVGSAASRASSPIQSATPHTLKASPAQHAPLRAAQRTRNKTRRKNKKKLKKWKMKKR